MRKEINLIGVAILYGFSFFLYQYCSFRTPVIRVLGKTPLGYKHLYKLSRQVRRSLYIVSLLPLLWPQKFFQRVAYVLRLCNYSIRGEEKLDLPPLPLLLVLLPFLLCLSVLAYRASSTSSWHLNASDGLLGMKIVFVWLLVIFALHLQKYVSPSCRWFAAHFDPLRPAEAFQLIRVISAYSSVCLIISGWFLLSVSVPRTRSLLLWLYSTLALMCQSNIVPSRAGKIGHLLSQSIQTQKKTPRIYSIQLEGAYYGACSFSN